MVGFVNDLSFDDSFIDFDSIREFFQESPDLDKVSLNLDKIDFWVSEKSMVEMGDKDSVFEELKQPIEDQSAAAGGSEVAVVKEEKVELEREENLGSFLEEEMGKVSFLGGFSPDYADRLVAVKSKLVGDGMDMKKESLDAAPSSVVPDGSVPRILVVADDKDIGNDSLAARSCSVDGIGSVNNVVMDDEDESGSDSESASEGSSPVTSSSDDDDDNDDDEEEKEEEEENDEVKGEVEKQLKRVVEDGEIEEGEIREANGEEKVGKTDEEEEEDEDNMVEWSDVEFDNIDEEEEGSGIIKGPIKSQNELKVLPLVPPVEVTLQPHHQIQPVGTVSSILSSQVIVEGVEKHSPLNEGSILWITEKRSPLGLVDEIFGPVQNPFYVVRYNCESEVPSGISQGTSISFVPEFAYHVLNEKNLYKKGYDASGENDEELSEEAEFSDDEKEAEYLRMKKISKRGMNAQTVGNKKNSRSKNRNGNRKNVVPPGQHASMCSVQLPANQNRHNTSSAAASLGNYSTSSNVTGGAGFFQPFSPMAPTAGNFQPSNGVWLNGMPSQQSQNAVIPGAFPANNMPWPAQNQIQHPYQTPITNGLPFQQQFNPGQGSLPNVLPLGGQTNLYAGPSPWPLVVGQNCFNQAPFGMGFQVQPNQPAMNTMNVGSQGIMLSGLGMEQNCNLQLPAIIPGNIQAPHLFNSGATSGRGRSQYNGRGGRFAGGRGRKASK